MTERQPPPPSAGESAGEGAGGGAGDMAEVLALADLVRESPDDDAAARSLAERCRGRAWLGGVPGAQEAVVGVMLQFLKDYPTGSDSPLQLASTAIEPPSAMLAFHTVFPYAEIHPQEVGEPDPRTPVYPAVESGVWRYEGMLAHPAVGPPSEALAARVRELAVPVWPHIPDIYRRSQELGGYPVPELLGVLVHPPVPPAEGPAGRPEWGRPDVWVRSVQVLACLGIAQHGTDQSWRGSPRARALLELLNGPEDWVTEAAGFALVASAWMDPQLRRDVGSALAVRWFKAVDAGRTRAVSIVSSLTELVLASPWLGELVIGPASDLLARIAATEPDPLSADRAAQLEAIARSYAPDAPSRRRRRFGFRRD